MREGRQARQPGAAHDSRPLPHAPAPAPDADHAHGALDTQRSASPQALSALQRTAGNRATRVLTGGASRSYSPPGVRVDTPAAAPVAGARDAARAPAEASAANPVAEQTAPDGAHTAREVAPALEPPADLAARWTEAQREVGLPGHSPSAQLSVIRRAGPFIRPGNKKDIVTMGADAAAVGAGVTTVVKTMGDGVTLPGVGEVAPAVDVLEFSVAAAEILTFVSLGLNIFSLGENLVRGWDAKIRLAAFTRAYEQLPQNDPLRPYLRDAAKQQRWEKNRRWVRVAVTAAIIGLTIAALTVASGGALLLAIAAVLAVGKAFETMRNLWRKYRAKQQQKAAATEMFDQAYSQAQGTPRRDSFEELLRSLNIPVPDQQARNFQAQRTTAIDQLAPHLSRTETAIQAALPQQAADFVARADAQADVQIAQVEAAAAAQGVDPEAQLQANGGAPAAEAQANGGAPAAEAQPNLPGQPEAVAS